MATLLHDLRFAVRALGRSPGFTAVAVLTLAIGIGANTAIFSVVEGALLQALPFRDASRLVWITETRASTGTDLMVDPPMLRDWAEGTRTLSGIAAWSVESPTITGRGEPTRRPAAAVSAALFPLLGVEPALGRWIAPSEDRAGAAPVVVLGEGLWRERFGASPAVLGQTLRLDDEPYTIIGVAAAGFDFPDGAQLWTPLMPALGDAATVRGAHFLAAIGRLSPGATAGAAQGELAGLARAIGEREQGARDIGARVVGLQEHIVGGTRRGLLVLLGAVTFVLLIACANVANLLLARGVGRRRELAVRSALGASAGVLARQLLVESVVLALIACAVGLAVAYWTMVAIVALAGSQLPRAAEITMNAPVLLYALVTATATGVLFGLAPALHAARTGPQAALKQDPRAGARSGRLRRVLVVGELAATVVLLAAVGLMLESFVRLTSTDPGFVPDRLVAAKITLPASRYADPAAQLAFYTSLRDRLAAKPDVRAAAIVRNLPISGMTMTSPVWVEGEPVGPQAPEGQFAPVSPEYFRVMGIPLVAGRTFTERDNADTPPVAVVSAVLAKRLFGERSPLGATLRTGFGAQSLRIVGVVGDVRHGGQAAPPAPQVYVPFRQRVSPYESIVLAGRGDPNALLRAVRGAVRDADPELAIDQLTTMRELLATSVAQPRFYLALLGLFAVVALILAVVGLYSVIAYGVARRTREIGIRVALGAERRALVRSFVGEALRLAGIGIAIGVAGAAVATRALSTLLYEVKPTEPMAFAGAALLLVAASAFASWLPALRAARVEPVEALRYE